MMHDGSQLMTDLVPAGDELMPHRDQSEITSVNEQPEPDASEAVLRKCKQEPY